MKIRLVARIKNENFIQARLARGFITQTEMARKTGINLMSICDSENFKYYPKTDWNKRRFEKALKCLFEDIFPKECREIVDRKLGLPIERVQEIKELPPYMERNLLLPSPEEIYEIKEMREEIESALHLINERESQVLKMRYGLFEGREYTLEEIANHLGVSKTRIQQIEAKALRSLKHPFRSKRLRDFIN